ncbi:outer membrane protein assembly factor BamB family protein [Streptomyces sp. NPDC055144]
MKRLNVQEGDLLAATADLLHVRSQQYDQGCAIAAFAADTGQRRRLVRLKTEQPPLSGTVIDDLLIYGTVKEVAAVAATDGKARRRVRPPRGIDTLGKVHRRSIADGRMYIGGNELHALDTATGRTVWRFGKKREASTGGLSYYGAPSVVDGVVYVTGLTAGDARTKPGSANDFLALRASDGELLWSYPLHTMTKTWPPPVIHGGILYRDTKDVPQPLLALDLKTHRPPWTFRSGIPNDGKAPVRFTVGRTALAANRLHLSCATTVVTLPADR